MRRGHRAQNGVGHLLTSLERRRQVIGVATVAGAENRLNTGIDCNPQTTNAQTHRNNQVMTLETTRHSHGLTGATGVTDASLRAPASGSA